LSGALCAKAKFVARALSPFALLFPSAYSYAQSCALCYTQAASSGSRIIQGLRSGILVLIIPPMFMSVAITILAYRKRNKFSPGPDEKNPCNNGW
jgi:hypothetical protein